MCADNQKMKLPRDPSKAGPTHGVVAEADAEGIPEVMEPVDTIEDVVALRALLSSLTARSQEVEAQLATKRQQDMEG